MTIRVALATWSKRWPLADDEDDLVASALRDIGVAPRRMVWDTDRIDADLCVIRTTWDYFERRDEFLAWADRAARECRLWNPPSILRWNAHKGYLLHLAERGVPMPDTALLTNEDPVAVIRERGWGRVMVKPAVGVGALDTLAADADETDRIRSHVADLYTRGQVVLQEYLPSIHTAGERSLIFFDGRLSHAVRKVPAPGDYRAHPYWGASVEPVTATRDQLEAGLLALAGAPAMPLYARVDLLERADGGPALIELELIEPYLFLDGGSARRLAEAILAHASGPPPGTLDT